MLLRAEGFAKTRLGRGYRRSLHPQADNTRRRELLWGNEGGVTPGHPMVECSWGIPRMLPQWCQSNVL